MNRFVYSRIVATAVLILGCDALPVRGAFDPLLKVTVSKQSDSLFLYQYKLTNPSGSTLPAVDLTISVDRAANLSLLVAAPGWETTYLKGDLSVDFASPSPATDLLPGSTALFSFESALSPDLKGYVIFGLDDASGTFKSSQGSVAAPSASPLSVPGPASSTLLGLGMSCLIGLRSIRRRLLEMSKASCGAKIRPLRAGRPLA